MADVYAEALQNYLHGSEWRQTMEMFVGANCMEFYKVKNGEFKLSHHELWKNFQDIVENILEMALVDVGGSIETLEKFMDEVAYSDGYDSGPKEAMFKDIVKQLVSYENFESFRDMMIKAAHYKMSEGGSFKGNSHHSAEEQEDADITYYIDTLTSMGYNANVIDEALGNISDPSKVTLDGLINDIARIETQRDSSASQPASGYGSPSRSQAAQGSNGSYSYSSPGTQSAAGGGYAEDEAGTSDEPWINYRRYCSRMAEALKQYHEYYGAANSNNGESGEQEWVEDDGENGNTASGAGTNSVPKDDHNEIDAKFVMAQSVLDNFNQGLTGQEVVSYLHWATSMLELLSEIETAYYQDLSYNEGAEGIAFDQYTSTRAPDGIVAQYTNLDQLRMKIETELGSAAAGLSDIELKRMAQLKAIADMGTENEQLLHQLITRHEEVQREITALHKKMSLYVSSHNYAIKRENIEELYLYLKEKVRGGAEISSDLTDEMHELVYHTTISKSPELANEVLALLLELNVLEDEECLLRGRIQELVGGSPERKQDSSDSVNDEKGDTGASNPFGGFDPTPVDVGTDAKESKEGGEFGEKEGTTGGDASSSSSAPQAEPKLTDHVEAPSVADSKTTSNSVGHGSKPVEENHDAYLQELKSKHLSSLNGLKDRLKCEKDRRLQDLEDRLMRRKLARKKLLASGGEVTQDDLEGDEEIEKQIHKTQKQMEKIEEAMVSGLKKKCLFEMKVLKAKKEFTPLTDEDRREADRLASEEMIKRYERDQKNLLTSLEAQRMKQKNKILARVKAKAAKAGVGGDGITPEVEEELRQIDEYFKEQVTNALLEPQGNVLIGLSCINSLNEEEGGGKVNKTGDEDEDDYFNEPGNDSENKSSSGTREWVEGIEAMKEGYEKAGKAMQSKLLDAYYEGQGSHPGDGEVANETGFVDMSGHMLKVITDAYCKHAAEDKTQEVDYKYGHGKGKDDLSERIKSGIMDEFEKSRDQYNNILANNKETSKEKLLARRRAKKADAKATDDAEETLTKTQKMLEETVESFLEEPLPPEPQPEIRELSPAKKLQPLDTSKEFSKPKALPPIVGSPAAKKGPTPLSPIAGDTDELDASKIRQKHLEKEKTLMDSLHTQMVQKKRMLTDRLKRKKEQRVKTEQLQEEAGMDNARVGIARQEEELAEAEVEKLQNAYGAISQMIKETNSKDIAMVDMEGVMSLLDKYMHGEDVSGLPMFRVDSGSTDTVSHVANSSVEKAAAAQQQKLMMQDEVKRISANYSEEKQKLDLAMKVEQARQRSTLQRKLLARKQQAGGGGHGLSHKAAGYPGDNKVNFANFDMSNSGSESKVYSGGQEAFRMPKSIPSSNNLGIASRGMNLGPLMRK